MSGILELSFMKKALKLFKKADEKGWHERNGGNLTYRLSDDDIHASTPYFNDNRNFSLDVEVGDLAGGYFLTTNTGSFIGNINEDPYSTLSITKIDDNGKGYTIIFGDGIHKPTSEFSSHLLAHLKKSIFGYRVIYHSHPEHIID
jgi:rhamnulose-1-phosphate aldolase